MLDANTDPEMAQAIQDQLDKNQAALTQAQTMMDGAAVVLTDLEAQATRYVEEQGRKAGAEALRNLNKKLENTRADMARLNQQEADLLADKEATASDRQKTKIQ